jgi:hypothetical protein
MSIRSASYTLGVLAFAGICAVCAVGGLKSAALAAPAPSLLFVSDETANTLTVFSLPDLGAKGTRSGLNQPQGLCSTPTGDIWVANRGTRQMLEYSPTGTLIKTVTDPDGYPFACSVDELAYANIQNVSSPGPPASPDPSPSPCASPMSGPGETEVYNGTSSTSYDNPQLYCVDGVAYEPADLYIVGQSEQKTFVLAVLKAGSSTIQVITANNTIHEPGMVQWDAEDGYLAIGDRSCDGPNTTTCVYHVSLTGTIIGTPTRFKAYNGQPICDMAQGVIGGSGKEKYLAGGDDESACSARETKSAVYRWAFPGGGAPTNYNNSTLTHPFGTAISGP